MVIIAHALATKKGTQVAYFHILQVPQPGQIRKYRGDYHRERRPAQTEAHFDGQSSDPDHGARLGRAFARDRQPVDRSVNISRG